MTVLLALLMLLCLDAVGETAPVRVCEHPDQSVSIILWATDDRTTPAVLQALPCTDLDSSDLPLTRARRAAWRLKPNGKVEADPTIETPQERQRRIAAGGKAKLKALGLTEDELEALLH